MKFNIPPAWRYYFGLIKPVRYRLFVSFIILVCQAFTYLGIILLFQRIIAFALPEGNYGLLFTGAFATLILILGISLMGIWARYQALYANEIITSSLRNDLLRRILSFSRKRYTALDLRELRFSLIIESERLDGMSYALFAQVIPGLIAGIVLSAVLFYINLQLLLIILMIVPGVAWIAKRNRDTLRAANREYQNILAQFSVESNTMALLMDLVHLQSADAEEFLARSSTATRASQANKRLGRWRVFYGEAQNLFAILLVLVVLLLGGRAVLLGEMLPADFAIFYITLGLAISIIRPIWSSYPQIILGAASLQNLYSVLNDEDKPVYFGERPILFNGNIDIQNVTFSYGEAIILKDFSLQMKCGQKIVILGPNGTGKTTIVHLLLGFYRPLSGRILADDIEYDQLDINGLRRQMGVVSQTNLVLPGTIWDNLTYGNKEHSRSEILNACDLAHVSEFVQSFPQGYDTLAGENGVFLSGGQKQRLALARALVRKPPFLILDEPTNHIDEDTLPMLLHSLTHLTYTPTILFITHDPRVSDYADHVIHMGAG